MMGNIGHYWINAKTYVFLLGTVKDFMKDIKAISWAPGSPSQIKFGIWVAQGSASLNPLHATIRQPLNYVLSSPEWHKKAEKQENTDETNRLEIYYN